MDTTDAIEKKPYAPPQLIEYGNLADITGSGLDLGEDTIPLGTRPEG